MGFERAFRHRSYRKIRTKRELLRFVSQPADITVTRVTPEVMADLRASQVQHLQTHAGQTIIQGWVPFDRVVTIAALPFVHHIRPPRYAMRR